MITTLDLTPWSAQLLTGNGQLAIDQYGNYWVVSNVRADNTFVIMMSQDAGYTWTTMSEYSFSTESPAVTNLAFDPAICIDIYGYLHIIGSQPAAVGHGFDIVHFSFNTAASPNSFLEGPDFFVTSEVVAADYDLVALANGMLGCAISVINPQLPSGTFGSPPTTIDGNCLLYGTIEFNAYTVDQVVANTLFGGETFGSVTLYTPDGATVEVYYNAHPSQVLFADMTVTIYEAILQPDGLWNPTIELFQYTCRWTDDRLTVVGAGTTRYVSQGYYTYAAHHGNSGHMLLGATQDTINWSFQPILGTPTASFLYPTLSLSIAIEDSPPITSLSVAYIIKNLVNGSTTGKFKLASVDQILLNLTDMPGVWNTQSFTWLRGTKDIVDAMSEWIIVGERTVDPFSSPPLTNVPSAMSGHTKAPIAILEPSVATIERNVIVTFDASNSSDADLNPIQFTWSLIPLGSPPADLSQLILTPSASGTTAQLFVPNTVGPDEFMFEVQVACVDLDINGNPIHTPPTGTAIAYCVCTVPFDPSPAVSFDPPVEFIGSPPEWTLESQERNSVVTIVPVVVPGLPSDQLSYQWVQTGGNPMTQLSPASFPTLEFATNGADILGDSVQFTLTVGDGVNSPVSTTVDILIDAYPFSEGLDSKVLSRALYGNALSPAIPGDIYDRNNNAGWGPVNQSLYLSDMIAVKRSTTLGGDDRILYISPYTVFILGDSSTNVTSADALASVPLGPLFIYSPLLIRRLFPPQNLNDSPPERPLWVDAIHTEDDWSVGLTRDMVLFQYTSAPLVNTDNPDAFIDLKTLTTFTFDSIFCTVSFNNRRVFVLSGPDGLVLLQIVNSAFTVSGFMEISTANTLLYGADNVQWVRVNDVESVNSGQVLIGTVDANGNTYETFVDLVRRTIDGIWNSSTLTNVTVATGEFLFEPADGYAGLLQAPFITDMVADNEGNITLTWTQIRPDLVNYYAIYYSIDDGESWQELVAIASGFVMTFSFLGQLGLTYSIRMSATNLDGTSPYSNVQTVYNGA